MNPLFSAVFVNAHKMLAKAYRGKYAVPHIHINNLEWAKTVLLTAEKMRSPLIVAASMGAIKYMGGYFTVVQMVSGLMRDLKITIPVALHLDHGNYEACQLAIKHGFSSVMFDGSHLTFNDNFTKSQEIIALAQAHHVSVEVELGTIGGEEDGLAGSGELANVEECMAIAKLPISCLAAGIGNVHGVYPPGWKSLNFERLQAISQQVQRPIVLHGGSGIPDEQVQKAISLGVSKINVNTELQLAFSAAIEAYIMAGKNRDMVKKGFDPRKLLKDGCEQMAKVVSDKIILFGSANQA